MSSSDPAPGSWIAINRKQVVEDVDFPAVVNLVAEVYGSSSDEEEESWAGLISAAPEGLVLARLWLEYEGEKDEEVPSPFFYFADAEMRNQMRALARQIVAKAEGREL